MRRRDFIAAMAVFSAAWPIRARAQPAQIFWIGLLGNLTPELEANLSEPFHTRLGAVFQEQLLRQAGIAARSLGVQLRAFGVGDPDDFDSTFAAITEETVNALLVLADPMLILQQARIVDFVQRSRLPTMFGVKEYAAAGGLMAYAPKMADQFRRAAGHVDKILRGAKPGDLPVEQPTEFEFIINLAAAKALGLAIPPALLARADEVIE